MIEELQALLDEHRSKAYITCHETCFCWELESYLSAVEYIDSGKPLPTLEM